MNWEDKKGIRLDLGCGMRKQPLFVGMDFFQHKDVDIVHDLNEFPYPIPDNECLTILMSHSLGRIKPWLTVDLFNELWRIMKPGGELAIVTPYGVNSLFLSDPLNCNPFTPSKFTAFDPAYSGYKRYIPKPWKIRPGFPVYQVTGTIEVIMAKSDIVVEVEK